MGRYADAAERKIKAIELMKKLDGCGAELELK